MTWCNQKGKTALVQKSQKNLKCTLYKTYRVNVVRKYLNLLNF